MAAQKFNRNWVSWYWGAVFLTLLPASLFVLTFVSPKGPAWWVWFVDAAPDWLMWIVQAFLAGWTVAAWKYQTRPLLQDLRRRWEQASAAGGLAELGASAETPAQQFGPAPPRVAPTSDAPNAERPHGPSDLEKKKADGPGID
jgi:hypothetical protein